MFEKEADYIADYIKARKESKDKITKVISVWSAREETIHDVGFQKGAEFGYNKAKEEMQAQIEKMKCCEICTKSKDWRNRSLCVECEQSKSHINFELRR